MKLEIKWWDVVIRSLLILAAITILVFCLMAFSSKELTTRESTLLGIFLTVFSLLASWIITHWYAGVQIKEAVNDIQERSQDNLRTYALKASEKVNNLSSELNKLAVYLEDELNYTEYHSPEDELLAKEERLESAIHLIRTLKSINDTSLSDWQGVIGDELEEIREEQAEKEVQLQNLVTRLEHLVEHQNQDMKGNFEHTQKLKSELETMRKELRMALVGASTSTLASKSERRAKKELIRVNCPKCSSEITFKQRPGGGYKSIMCSFCAARYISSSNGVGFTLEPRESKKEIVKCPRCETQNEILLDNAPGSFLKSICVKCLKSFRITRSPKNGILIIRPDSMDSDFDKVVATNLNEQIIEVIRKALPSQPWSKGTHFAVAEKLGLAPKLVSRVIDELIKRGIFLPQIDGMLIVSSGGEPKTESLNPKV